MTQAIEKAKHTPELLDAAKAVVAQWDSPNWKLNQPTGELINDLRAAIAKAESHKDAMARISGEYDWLRGRTFHSLTPPVPSSLSMEAKMSELETVGEALADEVLRLFNGGLVQDDGGYWFCRPTKAMQAALQSALAGEVREREKSLQAAHDALREAEAAFETIRVILIKELEEPARLAFWRAVEARNALRILLGISEASTLAAPVNPQAIAFQKRVAPWMEACFGPKISSDRIERNHRFLEEALELVQSTGCTASEAHQLVDYVYGTPVGETHQEIGGVMVTLAALCLAVGDDMHDAGETELARIWTKVEKIRAKQASKPKHSPLPEAPQPAPQADLVERLSLIERDHILDDNELRTIGEAIAALSAVPTQEPFAFCCTSFDIDACDCVNKNHGTARRG